MLRIQIQVIVMRQNETPFLDAVLNYIKKGIIPFHTPGHIQGRGVNRKFLEFWPKALAGDLAEVEHPKSHHDYDAVRKEAEDLLAELYGAKRSFFLCNGTTEGIQALCLAFLKENSTVLLPRNAHRSIVGGLILTGAKPRWVYPRVDQSWGMATVVDTETWLEESRGVDAAFHLYPNYFGMCQDLENQVLDNVPNLVDEAHGPHFQFSDRLPPCALEYNITAAVQSTHKILSSLTQSSWMHVKIETAVLKIEKALSIIESTSPNFLLWASLDAARALEAENPKRFDDLIERVNNLKAEIKQIEGLKIFELDGHEEIKAIDPLKLIISATDLGLNGFELKDELRLRGIMPELAETGWVLFIITPSHQKQELDSLKQALEDIARGMNKVKSSNHKFTDYPRLKARLTPKEAFFSAGESKDLTKTNGLIATEMVVPYPPGIPLVMPGEEITKEVIELIQYYQSLGWFIRGLEDKTAKKIRVL